MSDTKDTLAVQDTGIESKSERLSALRVAYAVCGGIGAVESIRAIRELRRHGADVTPRMTPEAYEFITELSVFWAAAKPIDRSEQSMATHLEPFDLVVVAPATLNTLSKASNAQADNPVTLLIASAIGGKVPVLFVPTMNSQMSAHPAYAEFLNRLESWGCHFYPSLEKEGRLKMPDPEALADYICNRWGTL